MKQQRKNSTNAQGNLSQSTEAVLKFPPPASSSSKSNGPSFKDGDGDGPMSDVQTFTIEVALNGFFVTIIYDDFEIGNERYVVETMDEVVELLRKKF
jgi:hypothetical protein